MGSPHPAHAGHCDGDLIAGIIAEFSEVLAFSRTRWTRYAEEVHPELSGMGIIVLQFIRRKGPVTATELSQVLEMDKSLISRQVAKLREFGLVVATESPEDRRVQLLTASDRAIDLLDRVRSMWASSYRERFEGWSDEELEALRAGLHRFNSATDEFRSDETARRHQH